MKYLRKVRIIIRKVSHNPKLLYFRFTQCVRSNLTHKMGRFILDENRGMKEIIADHYHFPILVVY